MTIRQQHTSIVLKYRSCSEQDFRVLSETYNKGNNHYASVRFIHATVKTLPITEAIRLHRFRWFGHVQRMEENRILKIVLYINLETRLGGRPRNRWHDDVRKYRRIVCGEEWQERLYDREEWKRLLRTARNRRILHMAME
jgi:hypothetical protein